MNSQDFVKFALQITTMLACALFFGQLMLPIEDVLNESGIGHGARQQLEAWADVSWFTRS